MSRQPKIKHRVVGFYDTETTTLNSGSDSIAYPFLYIYNDLSSLKTYWDYEPDCPQEHVSYLRSSKEMIARIEETMRQGLMDGYVPIIAAYNLMFDMQSIMHELRRKYDMKVAAQSSTTVYYLDLYKDERKVCRFWDMYNLELNGLAAMGRTAGVAKAVGDWDYSLVRTKETPLTDKEYGYAKRDVQVMPAYLKYLLRAHEYVTDEDLGVSLLTKTSVVRLMAKRRIGVLKQGRTRLKDIMSALARKEQPKTYESYALRHACFRGGLTFTSANYAMMDMRDVISLDVTSMHHTFISGRFIPVDFHPIHDVDKYAKLVEEQANYSKERILATYHKPFNLAYHAKIRLTGLRLREPFKTWGIATLARGKFEQSGHKDVVEAGFNALTTMGDDAVKQAGWLDKYTHGVMAFGKLMQAESVVAHMNEIEAWVLSHVYEYDSMEILEMEGTTRFQRPPAYVALQSQTLFKMKQVFKHLNNNYHQDEPWPEPVSPLVPQGIAQALQAGTLSNQFLQSYYNSTVKGSFNGIYGTQAQDEYKPEYYVDEDGEIKVDESSKTTAENYAKKRKKHSLVLYTYGQRIVAGSRMHLVIALLLIAEKTPKAKPTGGDTDSVKLALEGETIENVMQAIEPLREAAHKAFQVACEKYYHLFPDYSSDLKDVGGFDCENPTPYPHHTELWNKARISWDGKRAHVTMAGLSRPEGLPTMEDALTNMYHATGDWLETVYALCGYEAHVGYSLSYSLEHKKPKYSDRILSFIKDYTGHEYLVSEYQAVALYKQERVLGGMISSVNQESYAYIKSRVDYDFTPRSIIRDGKHVMINDYLSGVRLYEFEIL